MVPCTAGDRTASAPARRAEFRQVRVGWRSRGLAGVDWPPLGEEARVALALRGIVVRVADLDAARDRYTAIFGVEPVVIPDEAFAAGGQVRGVRYELDGSFVQLVAGMGPDSPVTRATERRGEGLSQVAFWVEDVDAEVARLRAVGVEFSAEPRDLPMGRMAFAHPRSLHGLVWELEQHPAVEITRGGRPAEDGAGEEDGVVDGAGAAAGAGARDGRAVVRFGLPEETSYGFAQAVEARGLVFVAGQVGVDGDERPADVEAQMRIAYRRIGRALAERGLTMHDVVDETLYVTDMRAAAPAARVVRAEIYGSPVDVASTLIGVATIGSPDARVPLQVEIRCTAVRP
jgi:enamine deaminase RidA (YjgF/YER057c/UK114 family)